MGLKTLRDFMRGWRAAAGITTYALAAHVSGNLISASRWRQLEEFGYKGVIAPAEINGIAAATGRPTNEILNHVQRLG